MNTWTKRPNAVLDYKFDWAALSNGRGASNWLEDGETIISRTVTVDNGDLTIDSSSITDGATSVTVWLSDGALNAMYDVTCRIVTSAGREDERTIRVIVTPR